MIEIEGLSIYGTPWCPDLSGFAYYATEEELIEKWKGIPTGVDVLITHTPAHGILDVPTSGTVNLGCPHLREQLKRIKPKLHVFGHVHARHGIQKIGETTFVNAAVVGGPRFEVIHPPSTLEI